MSGGKMSGSELLGVKCYGGKITGGRNVSGAKDWRRSTGDETQGAKHPDPYYTNFLPIEEYLETENSAKS